ncbi:uncharacterized protein LTR77_004700 [Saxophila tyrrhenica]|uniref:Glycoside hydrolase family 125 protein n=1 Tax=Saxophila tyrrhenica TaxID=1690608 RepID=A0AAV9PAQ9_9PEZI|nr:hypothetical protein LTR77_004700 [Saxophila tyrrhenica]
MILKSTGAALLWAATVQCLSTTGGSTSSRIQGRQNNGSCPKDYTEYAEVGHAPYSSGKYRLPYQRPPPHCRTYVNQDVEDGIEMMKDVIADPDLYRMFENSYPNTLDTTVKWRGKAADSDEELSFVITGDINAMWIRDSTSQLHSYLRFLTEPSSSPDSLASVFRGLINLQTRYILEFPYCNAFQPPKESGVKPENNTEQNAEVTVTPKPNYDKVWQCKYEVDSIASFLQLSADYYKKTGDADFFSQYRWIDAVKTGMDLVEEQTYPTYYPNGSVVEAPYTYSAFTDRATETLSNNAYGEPIDGDTGLVRSTFRPSDDACTYQLFVPGNMMLAANLEAALPIVQAIGGHPALVKKMQRRARLIRDGIQAHAISSGVFAFEIDGFGSINSMDDAGVPSLLSAPYLGYLDREDATYQKTRRKALSTRNPYWMHGPVINGTGSPHIGPGWSWPMGVIMQILTSEDDEEIVGCLGMLVGSTNGTGLVHESILATDQASYTRSWFAWVNGLFGEMIFDLYDRKRHVLKTSFQ